MRILLIIVSLIGAVLTLPNNWNTIFVPICGAFIAVFLGALLYKPKPKDGPQV
jgi:hypothetical protein